MRRDITPELVRAGLLLQGENPLDGIDLLISLLPHTDEKADLHERIALSLLREGESARALPYADSAILLGGSTTDRHKIRGIIRNLLWNDSGALEDFSLVLAADSDDVQGLQMSARILERTDPVRSLEVYRRLLGITGDDPFTLRMVTSLLIELGRFEEIPPIVERLFSVDLEITPAWLPLALLDAGRPDEATDALERVFLLPEGTELHDALRNLLSGLAGRVSGAPGSRRIERFSRLLVNHIDTLAVERTFPGDLIAAGALEAFSIGDAEIGTRLARRILDRTGIRPIRRYLLGDAALRAGNVELAIRLLDVEPENLEQREVRTRIFIENGEAHLRAGHLDSARLFYREAVRTDSLEQAGWLGLGRVRYLLGETGLTVDAFEHGFEAAPYDLDLIEHYAWILAVEGIHLEHGFDVVRSSVDDLGSVGPSMMELYTLLAFRTGRIELSDSIVTAARPEENLSPFGLVLWGDVYKERGNRSMAVDFWRRGIDAIDSTDPSEWHVPYPESIAWVKVLKEQTLEKLKSYDEERNEPE